MRPQALSRPSASSIRPPALTSDQPRTAVETPALGKQMAALFACRLLSFGAAFAIPLILVRSFSQADYGLYKQFFLIYETLASVLTLGLTASLYYFLPNYPEHRTTYVLNTLYALVLIGFLGGGALLTFDSGVAWLVNNPGIHEYLVWLGTFTLLSVIASMLEPLMVIDKRAGLAGMTGLASEGLRAALIVVGVVLTSEIHAVLVALIAWGICRVAALIVYLRTTGIRMSSRPRWEHLIRQLRYSLPFAAALLVRTVAESLHQYVVSHIYGPVLFAVYSLGVVQVPLVAIAFESASEVALIRITELRREGSLDEAAQVVRDTIAKLLTVLVPLYLWLTANARELILLLYTERFEASTPIFLVFLAIIPLTALSVDYVPRAFADTDFLLRVNGIRLGLSVVLLLLLLRWGLVGAALATLAAMAVTKFLIALRVRTLLTVTLSRLFPFRRLATVAAASGVATVAAWFAQTGATSGGIVGLILSLTTFAAIYLSIVWFGDVISMAEKRELQDAFLWLRRVARQAP